MLQSIVGILGGPRLTVEPSIPPNVNCRILPYAKAYHIKVAKGEYMIFQYLQIGRYACWFSQYFLKYRRQLYCKMHSDDVEFHCLLDGEAMYKLSQEGKWFLTSAGTNNVIVNPAPFTITSFTSLQMSTFDIHVTPEHFKTLAKTYPVFKELYDQMLLGKTSTLFPEKQQNNLNFSLQVNAVLRQMEAISSNLNESMINLEKQLDDIIASFAKHAGSIENQHIVPQAMMDKMMDVKQYISKNVLSRNAVAEAQKEFSISAALLNKNFKTVYKMTPREFLLKEKIREIKCFMKDNPTEKLINISMAGGFKDPKHANEKFKQLEGVSIRQYREILKDKLNNKEDHLEMD
ncbi:helix-turn-helix transcriptional regulator [Arachidicoccus ginsenosidivorans]|jgi:AraC-like DNA-binding protein|uniref:Helix-turn-helix transcriptional regulator n=1 Tax=Arachidicoccus ginsenosidivorans TaxID=496057 RepID=A0A5B8VRH7_9BACT|nr:AraC family transcriptional regulator [Arachidicoccus ginsenosidivorans]QEC73502.1 helix-turn-helix transcriptional regulator [Arachidicoccus ginsenosidivorans]